MQKLKYHIILFFILLLAIILRLYGLNWDHNQHLQPDERFLTMVANDISWPSSLVQYFDLESNPLSPYNNNYDFFVYGTFPIYLTKAVAEVIKFDLFDYHNITLVGRLLSALVDTASVLLVFKIGKRIFNKQTGLLAAFLYSISVLPIQLAHFLATDSFILFFLLLSFTLILKKVKESGSFIRFLLSGIAFGLALASKISAVYFLPIHLAVLFYLFINKYNLKNLVINAVIFSLSAFTFWRLADPKSFSSDNFFAFNPHFLDNLRQLQSFNNPDSYFPPGIQWITTKPIIFPLKNIILWGLGLPLGIISLLAVIYNGFEVIKNGIAVLKKQGISGLIKINRKYYYLAVILLWTLSFFLYQSTQYVKTLRYFLIIFPFLAILTSRFLLALTKNKFALISILIILSIYPLSFMAIYSKPHSRVVASEWIYEHIPEGSVLSCEHWDDCLPLPMDRKSSGIYQIETLELFVPDSQQKWDLINSQLESVDYIILSSNRLWGSIPKVPDKYPLTSSFYSDLLNERLGFVKVAEFTSYPTIPLLGIEIIDDNAEEAFTVYDHPKVIILKKVEEE